MDEKHRLDHRESQPSKYTSLRLGCPGRIPLSGRFDAGRGAPQDIAHPCTSQRSSSERTGPSMPGILGIVKPYQPDRASCSEEFSLPGRVANGHSRSRQNRLIMSLPPPPFLFPQNPKSTCFTKLLLPPPFLPTAQAHDPDRIHGAHLTVRP